MKFVAVIVAISCSFSCVVKAQTPVTIAVTTRSHGISNIIPPDFSGLSFGTRSMQPGPNHFFDSTNVQLITLFRDMGIRSLRMGGTSVDTNNAGYIPSRADIDALFRFAKSAGVKVIYSLKLLNGDSVTDASTAKYIWDKYGRYLDAFAIGNEPNLYGKVGLKMSFAGYLAKWRDFEQAIVDSIPGAKFVGPDAGDGSAWAKDFANSENGDSSVKEISLHYYVGGSSANKTVQQIVDEVLSPTWDNTNYVNEYNGSATPALQNGFPFRFTESNSYYTGGGAGVAGGNDCYATALFSLDFMYWWAGHQCSGVGFHTAMWKYNGTFFPDNFGNYQIHPIGYGIAAFNIGGHGNLDPVSITNPNSLNLTAYATTDSNNTLFVTIINKEHGTGARTADVTIEAGGVSDTTAVMYLEAPSNNPAATSGITLGGAPINDYGPFHGKWALLDTAVSAGQYSVIVPPSSAAIVWFPTRLETPFPTPPALISPAAGSSSIPRKADLKWNAAAGSMGYNLQVATDPAFSNIVLDTLVADTSVTLSTPLAAENEYYWRVSSSDSLLYGMHSRPDSFSTGTGIDGIEQTVEQPAKLALSQNYPNPFNPSTVIKITLAKTGAMSLTIYNVLGQAVDVVHRGFEPRGQYEYDVDMRKFSSGVYFYTLRTGQSTITRKMLLLK